MANTSLTGFANFCNIGIAIGPHAYGTHISNVEFENINNVVLDDAGFDTKADNLFAFPCWKTGIRNPAAYATEGNSYTNNTFISGGQDCTGTLTPITVVFANIDAGSGSGTGKVLAGNTFKYQTPGGIATPPNITGVALTGANPTMTMQPTNFFPGNWGIAGTVPCKNTTTGVLTGSACGNATQDAGTPGTPGPPLAVQLLGNAGQTLVPSPYTLTDSDVASHVLTIPGADPLWNVSGTATTITSIATPSLPTGKQVCFLFPNNNMVFTAGANMKIGSNFPGASGGVLCGYRDAGGIFQGVSALAH